MQRHAQRHRGKRRIAILGAKVYFIATGFLQQPLLPMAMGLSGYRRVVTRPRDRERVQQRGCLRMHARA